MPHATRTLSAAREGLVKGESTLRFILLAHLLVAPEPVSGAQRLHFKVLERATYTGQSSPIDDLLPPAVIASTSFFTSAATSSSSPPAPVARRYAARTFVETMSDPFGVGGEAAKMSW